MASTEKVITLDSLDRLSNSPREVIDEILTRMPIRDVVKTSLLSRGWRYRWMSMPDLVFDFHSVIYEDTTSLLNFVNKVISLHDDIVSKFRLDYYLEYGYADVAHWILILSRKMVKHLALLFQPFSQYQVPGCLFSCRTLTTLELKGCVLKLPSDYYNGLCRLTELSLFYVNVTNEAFEGLVLKNPLLRKLYIGNCTSLTVFNIYAPKLEEMYFMGSCENMNFRNAPKVRILSVRKIYPAGLPQRVRLDDVLQGLVRLENLGIVHPFLELPPMEVEPKRLDIIYHRLKYVELEVNFEDLKQMLAVLCLCRSSPHLKTIIITAIWDRESANLYVENFWEARLRKEEDIFNHLETVSLSRFKGGKNDMGFSQFILLNARGLRTFDIYWEESAAMVEKLPVEEKMMQFHRASTISKVVFHSIENFASLCSEFVTL